MRANGAFLACACLLTISPLAMCQPVVEVPGVVIDLEPIVPLEAGSSSTGCNDDDLLSVENPSVKTYTTAPGYDASTVDWNSFIGAVEKIGNREARVCTFAIRMMFHNSGATAKDGPPNKSRWQGADASVMSNYEEVVLPHNTQHGEAPMMRYFMERLAAYFGASWADALSVTAAVCTEVLGGKVNIADHCNKKDIPLYVNKYDFVDPISGTGKRDHTTSPRPPHATAVAGRLPAGTGSVVPWMTFWLKQCNDVVREQLSAASKWMFSPLDAAALMGSHTILDISGCATNGKLELVRPGDRNAGCDGSQRSHTWDNQYFKDMLAGQAVLDTPGVTCSETGFEGPGGLPKCVRGEGTGDDGRSPNVQNCEFRTRDFEEKTTRVLQAVKRRQQTLGFQSSRENALGTPFCRWYPNQTQRAPCCGWECLTCGENSVDRKWCDSDRKANEAPWLYTVNDCSIQTALRKGYEGSCAERQDSECDASVPAFVKQSIESELKAAFWKFKSLNKFWQNSYAEGHCKLNHMGAHFADKGPMNLVDLLAAAPGTYTFADPAYKGKTLDEVINIILSDNCSVSLAEKVVAEDFNGQWIQSIEGKQLY